jgi:3-hydroxybutyryl-CoA dehydrogenase
MTLSDIKTIAVCGAGTMGSGIAQLCATAGFKTLLYDINDSAVQKGLSAINKNLSIALEKNKITEAEKRNTLSRIICTSNIKELIADLVIEAVIELKEVKQKLFNDIASVNSGKEIIFATNTSSIPISQIAGGVQQPERVVGMHFFNPAHLMKLVEVISGEKTSADVADVIYSVALKMGKTPVKAKDKPGFIVNRIGKLYHTEPIKIVEDGVATVETVDALLEASGFKMGPFRLIDLIGVDANLNVTKSLYELTNRAPQFKPSALQQRMVDEGKLGKKSGQGFYKYNL